MTETIQNTQYETGMTKPLDFQSIIMTLQQFWAERGCLIWQPYYTQVGAGTMNPATALRVLGPEPWNVGYVEPSIRPDDGRYGDNPNRMQQFYQFQVILKPDPGNPQELYLQSLESLGIDPREHDIRFVEDNWESPALGAWGLGWEVWLDGQEITQFTYFQQSGGQTLDPVSVEITYGLERIAIALQRIRGFRDIRWVDGGSVGASLTYGDVNYMAEREHSTYYFEVADVERLHEMYDLFEGEAGGALARGLVLPAHDYLLKCSHTFNILDTRGAIGVTERQAYFRRMRALSRQIAEVYVAQREGMGFPWLKEGIGNSVIGNYAITNYQLPITNAPLLIEIGVEELPPGDMDAAMGQLSERVPALLDKLRLEHGEVRIMGTPRRLVIHALDVAATQPDRETEFRGPPADRAFDADGNPTRAAQGFARSKGVDVGDLQIREIKGGRYVVAVVSEKGRPSVDVFSEALPNLIASLRFGKTMRWNHTNVAFSRPVRWLLAMHGEAVIPFEYAGVQSGNHTRSLRFRAPEMLEILNPAGYFAALEGQGIILDVETRKQVIREQATALAAEVGGTIPDDPGLLAEVAHLVEKPTALRGTFAEEHLKLPREVLVSVMKKHQRYFPVERANMLLPYFIAVRNGDDRHLDIVVEGNEHVIRARFADADFFVGNDLKRGIEDFVPRLDTLTFQVKLGSMLDKTRRIEDLTIALAPKVGLTPDEETTARRAAYLCKADLATEMVVEMTSLQGIMGMHYAHRAGEAVAVAEAISEHYLPRSARGAVPKGRAGLTIGLADRLDSLTGLFAAGLAPTGNKDPFGLRRAALGLVQNLIAWDLDFDLRGAVRSAARRQPIEVTPKIRAEVLGFIAGRLRNAMLDEGYRHDVVSAVTATQGHNPAPAVRAIQQLSLWVARDDWREILPAYSRCVRITRDKSERHVVNPDAFVEDAERKLYAALLEAESPPRRTGSVDDFLNAFLPLIDAINRFFDDVLVMEKDETLQHNRLGLLQRIASLADGVVDMGRLEGF
ncbi:MAG: glycine--tRNA ligase subunit beta [Anaerolineales bacterium]